MESSFEGDVRSSYRQSVGALGSGSSSTPGEALPRAACGVDGMGEQDGSVWRMRGHFMSVGARAWHGAAGRA
jgi:hypothetical protein